MRPLFFLLCIFLIFAVNRTAFPDLDHGDEFSDACVLNAGENFVKLGFLKLYFLPLQEVYNKPYVLEKPVSLYTHYPPLSEIVNGFIRLAFKTNSLYVFRIFSLFLSWITIVLWYLFINKIANSRLISFLSCLFLLTNPLFIFGMDSLHESAYSEFLRVFILLGIVYYIYSSRRKKMVLAGLWMLAFALSLVTFEYHIYAILFPFLFRIFITRSKHTLPLKTISILISAQIGGLLVHFIQNSLYFGSFAMAFNDLKNVILASVTHRPDTSLVLSLPTWFQHVLLRNLSLVFPFSYPILFLGAFFSLLLYRVLSFESKEKAKFLFSLWLIFFLCGISWYLVMPSHSLAHAYVNFLARHLVPAAAIGFALFFYIIFSFIKEHASNNLYLRALSVAMVFVIALTGIGRSQLPVTAENLKSAQDFLIFKHCLLKLKEASKENDGIGLNYYRYPFIRYYTNRQCSAVFNKNSLEGLSRLPGYFIFFPYGSKDSNEMFQFLREKYSLLWECNSLRFPALFFQLKNSL